MRRVCIFCETWKSGGIESFLHSVLTHMDLTRIRVDLVASEICDSVFTSELKDLGVSFLPLSGNQHRRIKNFFLFSKLLSKEKYDVVHLNAFHAVSLFYLAIARKAGVPVRIAHSHNSALRNSFLKPLKLLIHRISSYLLSDNATDYWACSEIAAKFMFSRRCLKLHSWRFIPNGIDAARFSFSPSARQSIRESLSLTDKLVIGHIGRLCYQKNQIFLLQLLSEIKNDRPDTVLLLVGEGESHKSLAEKARELNLSDSVIFYGVTKHPEELYSAMDLFTFPSIFEGLGIAALEAQASGLPTLCSENVPPEAAVTELFRHLPMDISVWRDAVMNQPLVAHREEYCQTVLQSEFDIHQVSSNLYAKYAELQ